MRKRVATICAVLLMTCCGLSPTQQTPWLESDAALLVRTLWSIDAVEGDTHGAVAAISVDSSDASVGMRMPYARIELAQMISAMSNTKVWASDKIDSEELWNIENVKHRIKLAGMAEWSLANCVYFAQCEDRYFAWENPNGACTVLYMAVTGESKEAKVIQKVMSGATRVTDGSNWAIPPQDVTMYRSAESNGG